MTILDKVVSAVTPLESDEARAEARQKAQSLATSSGWLAMVLDHHMQLEAAFDAVKQASEAEERTSAQQELALLLTGHSIAEESVLYPAMSLSGDKSEATEAYGEQAVVKVQMAALDELEPMSQEYLDKLEHIRGAVAHHVYEEEGTWFYELAQNADADTQAKLSERFEEEFERYMGSEIAA